MCVLGGGKNHSQKFTFKFLIIIVAKKRQKRAAGDYGTAAHGFSFLLFTGCSLITFDDKQPVKCCTHLSLYLLK